MRECKETPYWNSLFNRYVELIRLHISGGKALFVGQPSMLTELPPCWKTGCNMKWFISAGPNPPLGDSSSFLKAAAKEILVTSLFGTEVQTHTHTDDCFPWMSWHSIGVHVVHHCTDVSIPGSVGSMFFPTVLRDLDLTFQCVLFMTSYRGGNSWLKILGRISQTVITYQINSTYFSQGFVSRRRRINLRFSWNKHRTFFRPLAARTLASIVSSQQPLRSPWVCHTYFDSSNYISSMARTWTRKSITVDRDQWNGCQPC